MSMISVISSSGPVKPDAPTIGTATAGDASASVTFTAPAFTGRSAISSYTVTSSPGSLTGTGASSPITVTGLTNGTAYTFTVTATNAKSLTSASSAASNSVTPVAASSFESIATLTPSGTTSAAFTSIPSTYKSLQVRITARENSTDSVNMSVNSLTGIANYYTHYVYGTGASIFISYENQVNGVSEVVRAPNGGNVVGTSIIDIIDYASTSKLKTARGASGWLDPSLGRQVRIFTGWINTTAAISTLTFAAPSTFTAGTTIALYGIK